MIGSDLAQYEGERELTVELSCSIIPVLVLLSCPFAFVYLRLLKLMDFYFLLYSVVDNICLVWFALPILMPHHRL
ncbi:hypothetical protein VNO77_24217 [Canavalia gladiata]|uniref:Uncharacterized protein n=1 Tax=Canavalia gladiata TaxID=3824 RepID=A0AAN9QCE6_CANGL